MHHYLVIAMQYFQAVMRFHVASVQTVSPVLSVNMLLKMALAGAVAFFVNRELVHPRPLTNDNLRTTLITAVIGSWIFQLLLWFPGGLIGLLLGLTAFWFIVTFIVDKFFYVEPNKSRLLTSLIVGITAVCWIVIGALTHYVRT